MVTKKEKILAVIAIVSFVLTIADIKLGCPMLDAWRQIVPYDYLLYVWGIC